MEEYPFLEGMSGWVFPYKAFRRAFDDNPTKANRFGIGKQLFHCTGQDSIAYRYGETNMKE
jgi:hypothetical protein